MLKNVSLTKAKETLLIGHTMNIIAFSMLKDLILLILEIHLILMIMQM